MMKQAFLGSALVVLALLPVIAASGQAQIEYGKEEELRGVTKIFIDTDGDLELRNNILNEIMDEFPKGVPAPLTVVDRVSEAELILLTLSSTTRRGNAYTELKALKVLPNEQGLRLLWQWGDENTTGVFGRRPSSRAADKFTDLWKKYNPELVPKKR